MSSRWFHNSYLQGFGHPDLVRAWVKTTAVRGATSPALQTASQKIGSVSGTARSAGRGGEENAPRSSGLSLATGRIPETSAQPDGRREGERSASHGSRHGERAFSLRVRPVLELAHKNPCGRTRMQINDRGRAPRPGSATARRNRHLHAPQRHTCVVARSQSHRLRGGGR